MTSLNEISMALHEKNKEIKTHVEKVLLPAREMYKEAEGQFEVDMARERLTEKAKDSKITETNAKNQAIVNLQEHRLALIRLESAYEKQYKLYERMLAEFSTLETEGHNIRSEVKRFER